MADNTIRKIQRHVLGRAQMCLNIENTPGERLQNQVPGHMEKV